MHNTIFYGKQSACGCYFEYAPLYTNSAEHQGPLCNDAISPVCRRCIVVIRFLSDESRISFMRGILLFQYIFLILGSNHQDSFWRVSVPRSADTVQLLHNTAKFQYKLQVLFLSNQRMLAVCHFHPSFLFCVSVPVLSEQITLAPPSVSTAGNRLIIARLVAIRLTPIAKTMVTITGKPLWYCCNCQTDGNHEHFQWRYGWNNPQNKDNTANNKSTDTLKILLVFC